MHYIDGSWDSSGQKPFVSHNPATGAVLWQGASASVDQVQRAVSAARKAFPSWADLTYEQRYSYVERFKTSVANAQEELTLAIAKETGKALWDAKSEVAAVIAKLTYASEAYQERTGSKSRNSPVGNAVVRHRPHGVMAVFGPYNFPAHLPNGHIMPALLAGNTIVFKPSEQTPMVGEWMVKKWEEAGPPPGVLNLVQGERDTGMSLAAAEVDGILFTGSSATGKAIHAQLGGRPEVLLALEMGGNNPLIVCDVTNISAAVYETILSAYTGSGQRCTCARRLILPEWKHRDDYVKQLQKAVVNIRVGAYDETPAPFMGPLISMREAQRMIEAQNRLVSLGAKIIQPIEMLRMVLPFVSPGIVDVTDVKNIPDEEYFGPLIQLYRVKTVEDAIAVANNTKFGLSASVFCDNHNLFEEIRPKLRAGLINWNRQTTGASGAGPFGGIGISGNHRPAGYYSADYCAYPVSSVEVEKLALPDQLPPGVTIG